MYIELYRDIVSLHTFIFDSSAKVCNTLKASQPCKEYHQIGISSYMWVQYCRTIPNRPTFSLSRQCWHFKSPDTSGINDDKDWRLRALKHATVLKRDIAILQTIIIYHHIQHNLFWAVSQTSVLNYHWHVLISLTQHATQFIKVNYSRRGRAKLPRAKTWKIGKNIRSIFGNINATYFRVVTITIYTIYKHNHEHIMSHYHYHCYHYHLPSKLL